MAATSYMRSWQDFDKVSLAIIPLFLFSATFYPLTSTPAGCRLVVRCTPAVPGGGPAPGPRPRDFSWALLGHAVYLAVMGVVGLLISSAPPGPPAPALSADPVRHRPGAGGVADGEMAE